MSKDTVDGFANSAGRQYAITKNASETKKQLVEQVHSGANREHLEMKRFHQLIFGEKVSQKSMVSETSL